MNLRKAILTGSIKYVKSPLDYPQKDIQTIGDTLQKRCIFKGTDIMHIIHSDKNNDADYIENIRSICIQLNSEKVKSYDLIVFYYSGHGTYKEDKQMSFLQISDSTSIAIEEVISVISEVDAKNKYFIIDACQSGGFSLMKPKSKIERQYAYNSEGVYCMFGTTKNQPAFEPTLEETIRKKVSNSYFTHFIAEALNTKSNYNDGTISIRAVDDYASKKTPTYTGFKQTPFSTTEIKGYFPFGFWTEKKELNDIDDWVIKKPLSVDYPKDREIDIVNYLHLEVQNLYLNDNYYLTIPDKDLLDKLSQPAKDILNEKLNLSNMKYNEKPLINGLINTENNQKYNFLIIFLENMAFSLDLTLKDDLGNTFLFEAINHYKFNSHRIIQLLFVRKYRMTDEEVNEFNKKFINNSTPPDCLENIIIALACNKLSDPDLVRESRSIIKIIFTLISFKTKKVVGYRLNHIALANNFLNSHQEYFTIFIRALKKYKFYDELRTKPSFVKKESTLMESIPFQEAKYDNVLKKIFPELYE